MAKREDDEKDEKDDERDDDESEASSADPSEERDAADESEEDESDEDESEEEEEKVAAKKEPVDAEYEDEDEDEKSEDDSEDKAARSDLATADGEEGEGEVLPTHLGAQKYVYSSFIAAGLIFAYIVGRSLHGIWAMLSNRDFFALRFPWATSIHDDTKSTYAMVAGGLIAIVVSLRTLRRPSVRQWADDVAGELVKVKWPNRKEVQNSTVVVIATSLIAVTYLFLLDRFFGFLTDRIYTLGGG
jgi:preprotein translocase subunit SecE